MNFLRTVRFMEKTGNFPVKDGKMSKEKSNFVTDE